MAESNKKCYFKWKLLNLTKIITFNANTKEIITFYKVYEKSLL